MADRLYVVRTVSTPVKSRLVKAGTKNQVESMLTAETWDIEPASPLDVADLLGHGVKVESVKNGTEAN